MRNLWGEPLEVADLPIWRKALIVCTFALLFVVGARLPGREADIYVSAPRVANPSTGQIYPVQVNHGYVRYLTRQQDADLAFWRAVSPAIIAAWIAGTALLVVTHRGVGQ